MWGGCDKLLQLLFKNMCNMSKMSRAGVAVDCHQVERLNFVLSYYACFYVAGSRKD